MKGATLIANLCRTPVFTATTAAALACAATDAHALSYRDILGKWCSATARLEFSRQAIGMFRFADKSHSSSKVQSYGFTDTTVTVYWPDSGKLPSEFGEFSADNRTMFLQPAVNVARREYRRC